MAKLTKQEYKILMEAQIDLTGYDNIKKVIEGTKSSKEAIQKLAEFTGMLKGMADTISKISKSGFKADLQSIAKTINQSMATFNSMPSLDSIQNVADPRNFATGREAKRRFTKNQGQVAAFGAVAQAKMIEVGGVVNETNAKLLLNLQKQLNAEKERTYKITRDIVETEKESIKSKSKPINAFENEKDEIDNTRFFEQDAENKRKEAEERYKERADLLIEEDKAQYAHQKNSALRNQKLWKISVQDQVKTLKIAKKERERILKDQSDAEFAHHKNSVARTQKIFVSSIQDQVKRLRKQKQDRAKLLKEQDAAEYAAHKESVAKAKKEYDKAEKNRLRSFGNTLKNFFSLERIAARMSFVITAKLSYDLFNKISRLPGQILQTWREFQAEISKTFALLANETKLTKDRLTNDVINLSKTYGIAAKEISTALYEIISAQVGVADASKVLEEAIKLSISGGGDITTAAHSLVQLMNAYDIAFSQAGRVSDIAFQTVKYGQLTLQQYTDQMSKVVATASILKIPLEEISAAIATMTINGINADQAFTALNQMLMTIANPTEKSKKLLSELGYNLSIGEVQAKGLGGALSELIPMLDMTGSANEELITILFKNRTGFKAVASLLQNMPDYYENYIRMVDSVGAAEEGLAERTNTVDFQMNRLKTTWEALMMVFIQGNNQSVVSFYKSLADNIDKLTKNSYLLFGVIKSIGIAIAGVGLKYLLASLSKLITMIKMIPAQLGLVAGAAKVTWASVTGGLSLVITLLAEAIMIIDQFAKKIRDRAFDKSFGLDKLEQDLKNAELDIKKFDSNLGKLNSVKTMISQWDSLNKVQNKNKQQNEALTRVYSGIKTILNGVGIKIDETGDKTANLMQYLAKVDSEITRVSNRLSSRIIEKSATESLKNIGLAQKTAPAAGDKDLSIRTQLGFNLAKKAIEEVENIIKTGDFTKIANKARQQEANVQAKIDELRQILSGKRTYVDIHGRNVQETWDLSEKQKQNISSTLDALDASMTFLLDSQKISMETYNIPDYVPKTVVDTSGGGGKPSEVSFMPELTRIFESFFGEDIYEDVAEIRNVLLKQLNDVKDNINKAVKDGSLVIDESEARSEIRSLKLLLNDNLFIQLFEEGKNAVARVMENAKKLKDSGDIVGAKAEYDRAFKIYQEYSKEVEKWFGQSEIVKLGEELYKNIGQKTNKAYDIRSQRIKNLSFDDAKEYGWTGTEDQYKQFVSLSDDAIVLIKTGMQRFWQNARTALIEMNSTLIDGAKGALSDEDFIKLALTSFGIDADVTSNWDALTKAIENAEEEGSVAKTEFLKFIADNTMTAYKDFLTEMFDLDQPEYVKEAISAIKSKIDNDKIVDKKVIQELIESVIAKLLSLGKNVSQEDRDAITKGVMPDTEAKGLDWKSAVGIADYENDNEAILDISKQAVSQLQAVWSFYWDWEIRQLQKQHDKKLQLLEDEKSIMLANENMSAQQRAIIEERFEEKKRAMQERMDKEMAAQKKKQAIFNASIDFARGLIGIWSSELSKGIFGLATAPILSGLLAGIFATQLALINNQKFAKGGYTGSGVGSPDETGYRPAGIVHEGELVIDKKTLDRGNLNPLMSIYQAMKSGQSFDAAAANYLMGNLQTKMPRPINSGMFAGGGYVGKNKSMPQSQEITIDFNGMKVLDPVELNRLVIDVGGKKRRKIGE